MTNTPEQEKTVKHLIKASLILTGQILSLEVSINRYNIIQIKQTLYSRDADLEALDTLSRNATMALKVLLKEYKEEKFKLSNILIITDVCFIPEDIIIDVIKNFYPDELSWSLPLPDYKLELLKKGIPVCATFEEHHSKKDLSPISNTTSYTKSNSNR